MFAKKNLDKKSFGLPGIKFFPFIDFSRNVANTWPKLMLFYRRLYVFLQTQESSWEYP